MAQFGYEEPPPKKIHKLSDDFERDDGRVRDALASATVVKKPASASSSSNNLPSRPEDCDAAAPSDDARQDSKNHNQYDSEPKEERMETNDFESADSHLHHLDVPSKISGNLEFPKSPPCPILHSTSNTVIANSVVQHRASSSPSAPSSLTMNRCARAYVSVRGFMCVHVAYTCACNLRTLPKSVLTTKRCARAYVSVRVSKRVRVWPINVRVCFQRVIIISQRTDARTRTIRFWRWNFRRRRFVRK